MSSARALALRFDLAAIGFSGLCLIHCLALPLLAAAAPLLGLLGELEWVHRAFVVVAIPVSATIFLLSPRGGRRLLFGAAMIPGLALLAAGAFAERLEAIETPLTVAGALLLAAAHLWRRRVDRTGAGGCAHGDDRA